MTRLNIALCALIAGGALASPAVAEDFVIDSDVTETNGGNTLNGDDTITVTNSGSVSTAGIAAYGLVAVGNTNTLTNSGSVSTAGIAAYGFYAEGDTNTLTNSGSVTTTGDGAYGLSARGANNTLTNSGSVTTAGGNARGLFAVGDTNTLTNSGSVSTTDTTAYGLFADGANNTLTNSGSVSTTGDSAFGLVAFGNTNTLTNSGSVSTTGDSAFGLVADGDTNTLTNSGSVSTTDTAAYGLYAVGANNTLTNSGSVSTEDSLAFGLYAVGANNTLTNSGSVTTTGDGAYGLSARGANNTLTNSGSVTTAGGNARGLFAVGDTNTLTNSGSVSTTDTTAYGLFADGANNTLTNSGSVIALDSLSVLMGGTNATLNLLQGSVLFGDVRFGTPSSATLTFGAGLNAVVHTDASVPATITSQGVYTVVGDTIHNVDLSDYTAQDQAGATAGRLIMDAVDARGQTPVVTQGAAGNGRWASVTGGLVRNAGDDDLAGYDGMIVSGSLGWDLAAASGFFAGVSAAQTDTDSGVETDAIGLHGGLYGQWNGADYTLAVGVNYTDATRTQANNMAPDGIESAAAEYMSVFISPALTWHGLLGGSDSLRLRYTGIWQDAHSFAFQDGDLAIDSRITHQAEARMAWTRGLNDMVVRYGVVLGWQEAGDIDLTVAGNDLSATVPGEAVYGRAFLGMDFDIGSVEVGYDSNQTLTGTAQLTWRF